MKMKKLLVLVLMSVITFSACGDSSADYSADNLNPVEYNTENENHKVDIDTASQFLEETIEDEEDYFDEDEPEKDEFDDDPRYDYYTLLDEEYAKEINRCYILGDYRIAKDGDMLYFGNVYNNNIADHKWYSYDIVTSELNTLFDPETFGENAVFQGYSDGTFYFFVGEYPDIRLIRTDKSGNILGQFEERIPLFYSTTAFCFNGPKMCAYANDYNEYTAQTVVLTPDFKILTELETSIISIGFPYNNDFYYFSSLEDKYGFSVLKKFDTETLSWESTGIETGGAMFAQHIGKYCILPEGIYNVETGEKIKNFGENENVMEFFLSYVGGRYNIELVDNVWYKVKYPSDGSETNSSQYIALGSERNSFLVRLNNKYYITRSNGGIVLRTFKYGEDKERLIKKFE